ncbi:MAG: ring-opening amidohydrolase [Leptolyngbya sp. DLM2.Bin15]|nr:MAG: ring-opening amidohydrolase [Leptolyngbya sp. DLM2.Bin15]
MRVDVFKIPQAGPDDVSGLQHLIQQGAIAPQHIVGILGKTEGNGCVNDFTRGFATQSLKVYLAKHLPPEAIQEIVFVMSGGTEGVLSPHLTVFTRQPDDPQRSPRLGLVLGTAKTRPFLPQEIGTMAMVTTVAAAVQAAIADAGAAADQIHFVQIKCPLMTASQRSSQAEAVQVSSYQSMALSRGASALGVAIALGELSLNDLQESDIAHTFDLYSGVASTSAGVELQNCEIMVLGNAPCTSAYVIGHSVMDHALDVEAVRQAMAQTGQGSDRMVQILAKAEASPTGQILGRRHTMLDDSDISHTRMARAVVGAAIASVVQDPMIYVSGGSEHQGPPGGGPVAAIARLPE